MNKNYKMNDNIIVDALNEFALKRKEFNVCIKSNTTVKRFDYNKDGIISMINPSKFYEGEKFMEKAFVDYFKIKHDVVYSQGTGFLIFTGCIWENCSDIHIQQLIAEILEKEDELTNAKITASFRMLINQVNNDKLGELLNSNRNRLTLKNGTLDITNIENPIFYNNQYFKDDYCTIQLNINYNEEALNNAHKWEYYLNSTFENDQERINLIGEILGYCLTPSCKYQKAFMFVGEGSNGKSVLLDIIDYIWGSKNVSDVEINDLNRAFARISLFGKLINKSSEIGTNIKDNIYFKKIATGDMMDGEYKGKDKLSFVNTAKLIFAMNDLPICKDKSDGFYRRLIIIPFNKKFKGSAIDVDLSEKLKLEADGIFMFALKGLQRLNLQKGFTKSIEVDNKIEEYKAESNPVFQFITDNYVINNDENKYILSNGLYEHYVVWCKSNGYKPLNNVNFGKELKRLNYNKKQKKIEGKPMWIFANLSLK
jgi:putative DNA primase/helicase